MDADDGGVREWESSHPLGGDLYTPVNADVVALLERMRDQHGSWREVAYLSGTRLKVLRRLRTPGASGKVISMKLMDRLITTTGVGELWTFTWFTADDLVALGLWAAPGDLLGAYPAEWKKRRRPR